MTRSLVAGRLVLEARVARTHLAITVELVHGVHTGDLHLCTVAPQRAET